MSRYKNDEIQIEVSINLANHLLGFSKIQNLNDLKTFFPNFIKILLNDETISWKEIPDSWKGKVFCQRKITDTINANYSTILNHLIQKDAIFGKYTNIESDFISVVYLSLNKFFIVQSIGNIVHKVNQYLSNYEPHLQIKNMSNSWSNGIPFLYLLSKASNGSIEIDDKGDPKSNFEFIKESFQKLNIPFVLTENCISSNPNEFCNSIQTVIFFKSINLWDENKMSEIPKSSVNRTKPEEKEIQQPEPSSSIIQETNDKKRMEEFRKTEEKIEEYKKASQDALNLLINEEKNCEKISICCSNDDIRSLRNYCHAFNASNRKNIQQQLFKIEEMWNILKRRLERTNFPIPTDLIMIDDLKNKLNSLEEIIKTKSENLEKEENKVKQMYEDIQRIDNLTESRNKFNELNEHYDMNHWSEFKKNTFVYILGEKHQKYEESLKESIHEYDELIKTFKETSDSINNEIQKRSEDLFNIQSSISKLDNIIISIKNSIDIILKKDPSIQLSENEFQSKVSNTKQNFEDYIKIVIIDIIEKEINSINCILKNVQDIIENNYSRYENQYSTDLCSKFMKETPIDFPECDKLTKLLQFIPNDSQCQTKLEEINKTIDDIKQKYDSKLKILNNRQNDCSTIEKILNNIKNKCMQISSNNLNVAFSSFNEINELIKEAESKKIWMENSEGETIIIYDDNMKYANEKMKEFPEMIKLKFDNDFTDYKEKIKNIRIYESSYILIDHQNNCDEMSKIKDYQEEMNLFISINEMFALNHNSEIDEIKFEINEKIKLVQQEIDSHPKKLIDYINKILQHFIEWQVKEKNELIPITKCYESFIERKLSDILSQKHKFELEYFNEINDHVSMYKLNVDITELTKVKETFSYLYIFYKSTLLLNPKERLELLKEKFNRDQIDIICACSLYVNIFKQKKYDFEISEEDITKVEDFVRFILGSIIPFGIDILYEFQKIITKPLDENQLIYAELLSESLECLSEFNILNGMNDLKFVFKSKEQYDDIINQINENLHLTRNLHLANISFELKKVIKKKFEKSPVVGENLLFIDFG